MIFFYLIYIVFGVLLSFFLKDFNNWIKIGIPLILTSILSLSSYYYVKKAVIRDAQNAGKIWTENDFNEFRKKLKEAKKTKKNK